TRRRGSRARALASRGHGQVEAVPGPRHAQGDHPPPLPRPGAPGRDRRRLVIDRDPARDWVERALSPLKRLEADVDVAAAVMARLRAEGAGRRGPAQIFAGGLGLAWAASFLGGVAALGIL